MPIAAAPAASIVAPRRPIVHAGSEPVRAPRASHAWLALLVVLAVSAAYVAWHLGRGWVPHDEGTLGQSAERVLLGQLSHRDFDDPYTGLLAMMDAVGFRVLGTTLWTLRVVLFAVFLAWVPSLFYIASRLVRPVAAAGMTLLAVVWSVPNYPAPMPSWYALFFVTMGVAALFRYVERRQTRWLVAAGVAGGVAFLVKVVGLYYVAGVLLFLVFQAQERARMQAAADPASARVPRGYAAFVSAALALFVVVLVALVRHQLGEGELLQFVLPGALIATLLACDEWAIASGASRDRFASLGRLLVPFLLGALVPVLIFLIPYAASGALGSFFVGVFVLPMKRFGFAGRSALPFATLLALIPLGVIAFSARIVGTRHRRALAIVLWASAVTLLALTARHDNLYQAVWASARNLLPALTAVGVLVLARRRAVDAASPHLREQTMALLSVTAMFNLIQFPFAAPVYFCYVAPLVALTGLALYRYLNIEGRAVPASVVVFFVAFAVLRANPGNLDMLGYAARPYGPVAPLPFERGGIRVKQHEATLYGELIPLLRAHARGGYTWAAPDCPEIYFLAGLQNPTRSQFDFFDEPAGQTKRVLAALEQHGITAIVMNSRPQFSPQVSDELRAELERRFPNATSVGKFQLRWRT